MNYPPYSMRHASYCLLACILATSPIFIFSVARCEAVPPYQNPSQATASPIHKPFSKAEIVELLQLETPAQVLIPRLRASGINFVATRDDLDGFATLGASSDLLAVIVEASQHLEEAEVQPIERQDLVTLLGDSRLSERQLVAKVEQRHLAFEMTPSDEAAFRKSGAGELLLVALWQNDGFHVPAGEPLTLQQIVNLLHAGTPSPRLVRYVRERKAQMVMDKDAADQIARAGGSESLIVAILANLIPEATTAAEVSPSPDSRSPIRAGETSQATVCMFHSPTSAAWEATRIYLDGELIAHLRNSRYICFDIPLGLHDIVCGRAALHTTFKDPGKYYLESHIAWNNTLRFMNYPAYLSRYKPTEPRDIVSAKPGMTKHP